MDENHEMLKKFRGMVEQISTVKINISVNCFLKDL